MFDGVPEPATASYASCRLTLSYCRWENPGAPRLMLIHGGKDHNRNWDRLAGVLRADYDIVAPDLRGHGDSDWSMDGCYYRSEFVIDIANLVDHLGWQDFAMVGHSLGATVVSLYAAAFPARVTKMVAIEGLVSPPWVLERETTEHPVTRLRQYIEDTRKYAARRSRDFDTLAQAVARMREQNPHFSQELAEHLTHHNLKPAENGGYTWKLDPMMNFRLRFDISRDQQRQILSAVCCPALLLRGEDSWARDPLEDGTAACFAAARVHNIPDAGHWVHHDQPEIVEQLIKSFLAEEPLHA
ncbi:MAG: alpha/beta hydrolase [Porticoccaceae bacterium]